MAGPWTDQEIAAAIESYFVMLVLELASASYSKTDHRRRAQALIPSRSAKSIEFKWMNISAILAESRLPWIAGYKPAPHYQRRLRELTGTWLLDHPYLRATLESNGK